jgi:hypothetical protein
MQVMLSETTACKYLGTESPLGECKSLRLGGEFNAVVSRVFADFPDQ